MLWVLAGIVAIETAVPILWWTISRSVTGIWYLITWTTRGRQKRGISTLEALRLLEDRELQIARISDEIRDIKAHIQTNIDE